MIKNIFIIILVTIVLSLSYAAVEMLVPVQTVGKNVEVQIPKGATFRQAADILSREKLIRDKKVFMVLGRLTGADRKIRAGYYSIWSSMSPLDIFRIIRQGRIIEYEVKVLEGDSLPEIAEAFARHGIITTEDFMKLSADPEFLSSYAISSPSFEGYIFPDTYMLPKGIKAEEALGMMIDRMREKTADIFLKGAEKGRMTEAEVLTLASIIEKEAVMDSERPIISAVYHNRLKKHMLLQADPTSIYGIKSSKERIMRSDLLRKTPYNTYVVKGLPPGPIASPGVKSVAAALNPAPVPYLYFVSNNDGSHTFSVTLGEHEEAVRSYRDKKKIKAEG
ncbi:MAG: endolytic transglycosylase MltG [Nitrospirae bacterium]|nr:MAG: endolytic transglycosylase MltG [Nitrospirota bacterium]